LSAVFETLATPNPEPRTRNPELGTLNLDILRLVPRTFVRVLLLEAAIVIGLVLLGRLFS
jgi:hypothetical protein